LIGAAKIGFRGQFRTENEGFFDADSEGFVKVILRFGKRNYEPDVRLSIGLCLRRTRVH
jgi:hypothetical protein